MSKFKFTKKSKRVFELSQKLNDGLISESEGQELNQLIKDDAELQLIYLGLREQELELTSRFSGTVIADRPLSGELVIPHQETARFYRIVTPLSIIIILIMAIFLGRDLLSDKKVKASSASVSTVSPVPQKKPFKETLASIDVVLGIDERDLLAGKELYAGVLEFEQGKLCLSMSSGMKMTIEGPAKINLLSADSIEVLSGKLRFKSQLQRHGFTVSTPQATITSQEAEFGLWLNSEVASLSCFSGSLRVRQKSYTQLVDKGQSISLLKNKKVSTPSYISLQELEDLAKKENNEKLQEWRLFCQTLKKDPDTAFIYEFIPNIYQNNSLIQGAYRGERIPGHGNIIGAKWSAGRFPKTQGLNFEKSNDRVKFLMDEKFTRMTVNIWLKIAKLEPKDHYAILLSEKFKKNEFTLQFTTLKDNWRFKLHSATNMMAYSESLKKEDIINRWNLLSLTVDTRSGQTTFYLNGEKIATSVRAIDRTIKPIYFGWVDLMNWVPRKDHDIRNTPGQLDFLSIHRRVFSAQEIKELYDVSTHK